MSIISPLLRTGCVKLIHRSLSTSYFELGKCCVRHVKCVPLLVKPNKEWRSVKRSSSAPWTEQQLRRTKNSVQLYFGASRCEAGIREREGIMSKQLEVILHFYRRR
jgi:hypothetical protein